MVIVGISGTLDSKESLEPVVDVEQLFDDRYIARKREERFYRPDELQDLAEQTRVSGSAVLAVADTSTFLSADDMSNIKIGHACRTSEMLRRLGD